MVDGNQKQTTHIRKSRRTNSGRDHLDAPKKKKIRYLVGAWISGTAATLLLFLFINDACFPPSPSEAETQNGYVYQPNGTSFPLPENWEEMQLLEKSTYLSSQYTQHRKLRQTRILQIIKENQLR